MSSLERIFLWAVRGGIVLLLFTPAVISKDLFFPFITGKNFYFRIFVVFLFVFWLILALLRSDFRLRKGPILYAFTAFVFVMTIATIFGVDPYHSFWSNFERMEGLITHLHLLALFMVLSNSIRSMKEWFYLFNVSVVVSIFVAVYALLQSLGVIEIVGAGRTYSTLGNSIYLAVYMMFHMFILAALMFKVRYLWARLAYAVLFLFELYIFFIASSRGALIGFGAGVLAVAVLILFSSRKKIYSFFAIGAVLFLILAALAVFKFPNNPIVNNVEVLSRLSSVSLENLSEDPRIMIWGIAWNSFKEKPILGWGPENFVIPFAKHYDPKFLEKNKTETFLS